MGQLFRVVSEPLSHPTIFALKKLSFRQHHSVPSRLTTKESASVFNFYLNYNNNIILLENFKTHSFAFNNDSPAKHCPAKHRQRRKGTGRTKLSGRTRTRIRIDIDIRIVALETIPEWLQTAFESGGLPCPHRRIVPRKKRGDLRPRPRRLPRRRPHPDRPRHRPRHRPTAESAAGSRTPRLPPGTAGTGSGFAGSSPATQHRCDKRDRHRNNDSGNHRWAG